MADVNECSKCILTAEYPNIEFDENGVCNYCNYYEKIQTQLTDFDQLGKSFQQRIEHHRGSGKKYDCLVGLSGGKDSSYVLYYLVRKCGLRVLAYTGDNGFLTEYAFDNIRRVVNKLDVDHLFFRPRWGMAREFYQLFAPLQTLPACLEYGS